MGTSTDAILFFGITADEPIYDWEDQAKNLNVDISEMLNDEGELDDGRENWELTEEVIYGIIPDECGYGTHCSGEHAIPYIYVRDTHALASRGYPEKIPNVLPQVSPNKIEELNKLTEKLGWSEPGWYLVSDWC